MVKRNSDATRQEPGRRNDTQCSADPPFSAFGFDPRHGFRSRSIQLRQVDARHAAVLDDNPTVDDHRVDIRRLAAVNEIGNDVVNGLQVRFLEVYDDEVGQRPLADP